MASSTEQAAQLLSAWKGGDYSFGTDVLGNCGAFAREYGATALIVSSGLERGWIKPALDLVCASIDEKSVSYSIVSGSKPNSPREDVYRIALEIERMKPDSVVALGGGSTIDAVKAAAVLAAYSPEDVRAQLAAPGHLVSDIEPFLGVGLVTNIGESTGRKIIPVIAVETVASSAAHLTKYANVTDPAAAQKKLIVDMAIVPPKAVFDYSLTASSSKDLTLDGALDGISHLWEVFMGASGKDNYSQIEEIAACGMELITDSLPQALADSGDMTARTALGLGTDLGGYAIMVGGTNGGHLGSFSLVDILSHGRACAVINPYYTVLFAKAIEPQLHVAADIFSRAGYLEGESGLSGRKLGEAVAGAMLKFAKSVGFPTSLGEAGATKVHIERMLSAAANPQLASKLMNMPVPMESAAGDIDRFMRPTLMAALSGDLTEIPTMG